MNSTKLINFLDSSKNKITPFSIDSVEISGFMGEYLNTEDTIPSQYKF